MSYTIPHFQDGTSPLFIACQNNHGEIVDRLLIAKADVNLQEEVQMVTKTQSLAREMRGRPVTEKRSAGTDLPPCNACWILVYKSHSAYHDS